MGFIIALNFYTFYNQNKVIESNNELNEDILDAIHGHENRTASIAREIPLQNQELLTAIVEENAKNRNITELNQELLMNLSNTIVKMLERDNLTQSGTQ
jgi:hypothetical protein